MISTKIRISVLVFTLSAYYLGAQCPVDNGARGLYTDNVKQDAYPYTTFFRADPNGSFTYNRNLIASVDTFRDRLSQLIQDKNTNVANKPETAQPYNVYERLHTLATKSIEAYGKTSKENERKGDFSFQLKAKAFVLICATDLTGNSIDAQDLKDIRDDVDVMFSTIKYKYSYWKGGEGAQGPSKNLIHYLQAYDYLMTDAHLSGRQSDI